MKETRFLIFWRLANELRAQQGLAELTFGPARDQWLLLQAALGRAA